MASTIKVDEIKSQANGSAISIASGGGVTINQANPTLTLGANTTFPAGSIIQVKHYTFTSAKTFTNVNGGAYRWITDTIKGGSSDYITFDNPIKSGNHVLLYFNAPITTEDTDLEYLKLFIREGSATTDGINAGVNVSGQSANGITGTTMYFSSTAQHGSNFGTMSFAHKFAPTAVTGSTVTNPNLSIVFSAKAYSSTNIKIHIGGHHYSTVAMVEEGYQVTLQEIQV